MLCATFFRRFLYRLGLLSLFTTETSCTKKLSFPYMPCDSSLTGNNARRRKVYLFNRKISDRQLQGRVSKEQKVVVTPDRL